MDLSGPSASIGGPCGDDYAADVRGSCARRRTPPIAFGVQLQDGGMVDEAVDRGDRDGGIGEDLPPFAEGLVAGDDQRAVSNELRI